MQVELVTLVMIQNDKNEVLVQKRKLKYPGIAFPGGHVNHGESMIDCAIREVKEETNLVVKNLTFCGVVHWANTISDERYMCFMYKTHDFQGDLLVNSREGDHFWMTKDELFETPLEQFSSPHYALSPLLHDTGKYSEVFITWDTSSHEKQCIYK